MSLSNGLVAMITNTYVSRHRHSPLFRLFCPVFSSWASPQARGPQFFPHLSFLPPRLPNFPAISLTSTRMHIKWGYVLKPSEKSLNRNAIAFSNQNKLLGKAYVTFTISSSSSPSHLFEVVNVVGSLGSKLSASGNNHAMTYNTSYRKKSLYKALLQWLTPRHVHDCGPLNSTNLILLLVSREDKIRQPSNLPQ